MNQGICMSSNNPLNSVCGSINKDGVIGRWEASTFSPVHTRRKEHGYDGRTQLACSLPITLL